MRLWKTWAISIISIGFISAVGCGGDDGTASAPPPTNTVCTSGYYWNGSTCIYDNSSTQWNGHQYGAGLEITDTGQYRLFLREYGVVCDRNDGTLFEFMDFWSADCEAWDTQAWASLVLEHGTIPDEGTRGVFRIFAFNDFNTNSYVMLTPIDGLFLNVFNNTAFELKRVGGIHFAYNADITVHLLGRPEDSELALVLSYRDVEFARAVFPRL